MRAVSESLQHVQHGCQRADSAGFRPADAPACELSADGGILYSVLHDESRKTGGTNYVSFLKEYRPECSGRYCQYYLFLILSAADFAASTAFSAVSFTAFAASSPRSFLPWD